MIERTMVDGRQATVAYLHSDWSMADGAQDAQLVKVIFDDGGVLFLKPRGARTTDTITPLYIERDVVNVKDLQAWAYAVGLPSIIEDLHVTQLYSSEPVDWSEVATEGGTLVVKGPGRPVRLGDVVALQFDIPEMQARHRELLREGASHDFPSYVPHVSITYSLPPEFDVDTLPPYTGDLQLAPERFEELKDAREVSLRDFNPYHEPGGSETGGQFTTGGGTGGGGASPSTSKGASRTKTTSPRPPATSLPKAGSKLTKASASAVAAALTRDFLPVIGASFDTVKLTQSGSTLKLEVFDSGDEETATAGMVHTLDFSTGHVEMDFLEMPASEQGKGLGKDIVIDQVELYKSMGFTNISLTANLDVGGYAWAKYGWVPTPTVWKSLYGKIDSKLASIQRYAKGKITGGDIKELRSQISADDPRSIWKLVDSPIVAKDVKIGKAVLLGTRWYGELDVGDKGQQSRLTGDGPKVGYLHTRGENGVRTDVGLHEDTFSAAEAEAARSLNAELGGGGGSTGFVSPNIHDLKIEQAAKNLTSSARQGLLNDAVREIHTKLGLSANSAPVIGAWSDGAENSVMVSFDGNNPELEKAALAMEGYIADQKAVLYFHPDQNATEFMARFTAKGEVVDVHKDLLERGLAFHTLRPTSNGTVVYVYGQDQDTLQKFGAAANAYEAEFAVTRGKGEFIGTKLETGSDREQRDDARRVYEEAIGAASGGKVGPVWAELRDRWAARLKQSQDRQRLGWWLDFNPNHDPDTGEFSEGGGSGSGARTPLTGTASGSHPAKISPSRTSTNRAIANSEQTYVPASVEQMAKANSKGVSTFGHNVGLFRNATNYPGLRPSEVSGGDRAVAHNVVERVKDNLRFLYSKATTEQKGGVNWYRGAHGLITAKAKQYNLDEAAVTGVFAALSPQKDWDQNIYLANSIIDIYQTKQKVQWTDDMSKMAATIFAKPKDAKLVAAISGKRLEELSEPRDIAAWVRTYEETYGDPEQPIAANPKVPGSTVQHEHGYRLFQPADGRLGGFRLNKDGSKSKVQWSTLAQAGNAIVALRSNGDRLQLSSAMGDVHKVRNFYNNLLDPDGLDGDVTIDTHAIGASWIRPYPTTAAAHGLASAPEKAKEPVGWEPSKDNKGVGAFGTYGVYADAYREVAKDVGLLPNQLQAVVWVVKRDAMLNTSDKATDEIDAAWKDFHDGRAELKDTQDKVWLILTNDMQRKKS